MRRDRWGWRPPRAMRAPWSAVRNSSNPSCWNARRRRLLHSGPNVFVITPQTACLPASPRRRRPRAKRATRARGGAGALSPSHFTDPAYHGSPEPSPRSAPPPLASQPPRLYGVWPLPGAARFSHSAPRAGAGWAPQGRPSPAEPFTPPLPATPSAPHSALVSPHLPPSTSRAPHRRLQSCPAKPRPRNENTH